MLEATGDVAGNVAASGGPAGVLPVDTQFEELARVNRGGAWTDSAVPQRRGAGHSILSAARTGDEQNSSDDHMGFRVCVDEGS